MTSVVGLVRGINVGGRNLVAMSDLRDLLDGLRFSGARTLLQSGNLVFQSPARTPSAEIERLLEREARKRLGLEADFLVRTAAEWGAVIERNPFAADARRDPAHLLVMALKNEPTTEQVDRLRRTIVGGERVHAIGRHTYVVYPDGIGRSKLTSSRIEMTLGTRGTARNWNTVLKLQAALSSEALRTVS
jgi:uncharacterized protein (DUF1697 family)